MNHPRPLNHTVLATAVCTQFMLVMLIKIFVGHFQRPGTYLEQCTFIGFPSTMQNSLRSWQKFMCDGK